MLRLSIRGCAFSGLRFVQEKIIFKYRDWENGFPSLHVHFHQIFVKHAGDQNRHTVSNGFKFKPDRVSRFGVTRPWMRADYYYGISRISRPILIKFYVYHQCDRGNVAFRFWSSFHQNYGRHRNRKLPFTYNGENDVFMLTPSVLIDLLSNLQVSQFGQIGPLPSELGVLECLKYFQYL